ncbi:sensor histidine kinase [Silvanigrella aquatica]|uniref:histidine kinase n=1 Tax=Silvanigrella aquatica TaxID=1915309 RepID=A0A1L4CX18_9BACT|nr:HAMP domain-containing sensor histidine kinase [Silvanigrella aquatica]APJ02500.1 hypothetical protein AXG55_00535 [Silvanigrella aquatica]
MIFRKSYDENVNLNKIKKNLNIITFISIFSISFLIIIISLIGTFQLRNQNLKLISEKKEQVFKIYLQDLFQRLLLLSNSPPFIDYLYSGTISRQELENDLLKNMGHYVREEIIGYQIYDPSFERIISVGRTTGSEILLNLCYINNSLNANIGRCVAKIHVYLDHELVLKKIKEIEPSASICTDCSAFQIKDHQFINNFEIIGTKNFKIPFTLHINDYSQMLVFILASLFLMMIISGLNFYFNIKFINKYLYFPLKKLFDYVKMGSKNDNFILEEVKEIVEKIDELKNEIRQNEKIKKQDEIVKLAQVAHDIKSPLVALNAFAANASELPEENRIWVRNAIQRMQDIANSLILKHQEINNNADETIIDEALEPYSVQLLTCLINALVSEKRMQYRDFLGVEILENFSSSSYGLFANIQPKEFKRVISNLINNAVEALNEKGKITLDLQLSYDKVIFSITDNGRGIPPDVLPLLTQRGATFSKEGGSGLGLFHAKTVSERWGGQFEISSEVNVGTKILITLPKASEPQWFISTLNIYLKSTVVIIDDDASIHNIWNERFQNILKKEYHIKIIHFTNPTEVIKWHTTEKEGDLKNILYLCDYEFINHKYNGIDLINKLNILEDAILVTSRFEEEGFRDKCEKLGIKMIPKNLSYYVPIKIIVEKEKPHAILIDDELYVHSIWNLSAKERKIVCYQNPNIFLNEIDKYDFETPIYIDSCLANEIKGEEVSKKIFDLGFTEIYLATSFDKNHFPKMHWIKGVRGKDPPWVK